MKTAAAIRETLTSRGYRQIGLSRKYDGFCFMPSQLWASTTGRIVHVIEYRDGAGRKLPSSRRVPKWWQGSMGPIVSH